ncbi:MAG TPA: stage III sporulation protein SpoAB [Pseudogracilibacillus sp.]|nr:stage III sporulation protein SpoAB [Pseudogracilibacillus sp.]
MTYIGACFVILASTFIGFEKSNLYIKRTKNIKQMIDCLHIMEAEIVYNKQNLQDTFQIISRKTIFPMNVFFLHLAKGLEATVTDIHGLWQAESQHLQKLSTFQKEEIDIWNQFGFTIGDYTSESQQQQINLAKKYLQQVLVDATEERQTYSKLYKTAGFLFGLFIIILLL